MPESMTNTGTHQRIRLSYTLKTAQAWDVTGTDAIQPAEMCSVTTARVAATRSRSA